MRMLLPALAVLLLTVGCGSDEPVAVDPGAADTGSATAAAPPTTSVDVRTRDIATVIDSGTGVAELCLGPVAESWPPQCSGPDLAGWDWAEHRGSFERSGSTRWGEYVVQGTWDGTSFRYDSAVPAALYDAVATPQPTLPPLADPPSAAELGQVAERLVEDLPGVLTADVVDGRVLVDVVYDDGSLQADVDAEHGVGVVVISSALVPVLS